MFLRKSTKKDISAILEIINQAQEALKLAKVDQWQNNYPNQERIELDIAEGVSYVVELNQQIVATVALFFSDDPNYLYPLSGQWISEGAYSCIHRIAISNALKGSDVGTFIMDNIKTMTQKKGFKSIRVDTHKDNLRMINYLKKHNFIEIGVIALADGALRNAYEYVL